jgi:hypothetical protein
MTSKDQQWMSTAGRLGILAHNIKDRIRAIGGYPDKTLLDEIRTITIKTVINIIGKYAPNKYNIQNKTKKKKKNNKNKNKQIVKPNAQPIAHTTPPKSPNPTQVPQPSSSPPQTPPQKGKN